MLDGDESIIDYFIKSNLTDEKHINRINKILKNIKNFPEDQHDIINRSNMYPPRAKPILKKLWLENYIKFHGDYKYSKILKNSEYDISVSKFIEEYKRENWNNVKNFINTKRCLMEYIVSNFTDNLSSNYRCEKCSNCTNNFIKISEYKEFEQISFEKILTDYKKRDLNHFKPTDFILMKNLENFREDIAENLDIPESKVLNNRQIINVIENKPANLEELKRINGIGEVTVNKYGKDIIKILIT